MTKVCTQDTYKICIYEFALFCLFSDLYQQLQYQNAHKRVKKIAKLYAFYYVKLVSIINYYV